MVNYWFQFIEIRIIFIVKQNYVYCETKLSDLIGKQMKYNTMNSSKRKSGFLTKAIKKGKIAILDSIHEAQSAVIEILKYFIDENFKVPENPKKQQFETNEFFCYYIILHE